MRIVLESLRILRASVLQLPSAYCLLPSPLLLATATAADDPANSFQGEWRTTISIVKLEQKGDAVTGTYGNDGQFPLKGTVKDNVLTFELQEGQVKGDGQFTIDATGNAFKGTFQIATAAAETGTAGGPTPKPRPASRARSPGSG